MTIIEIIFYILCFFPFVVVAGVTNGSDIQPYCLILSIPLSIYFLVKNRFVKINIIQLYLAIALGICIGIWDAILYHMVDIKPVYRYIATYTGLISISYVAYSICKYKRGLNEKLLKLIINIWGSIGLIQLFVNRQFAYEMIANARTSGNRGVTSLASEPSYYGAVCVLLLVLTLNFKKDKYLYQINLLIQILFIAKSSVSIVYLLCFAVFYMLCGLCKGDIKSILSITLVVGGGILGLYVLVKYGEVHQRITMFAKMLFEANSLTAAFHMITAEESVSIRLNDILFGISGFIEYLGLPHGFYTRIISSGYGSLLYTMGWIGVFIIFDIYVIIRKSYKEQNEYAAVVLPLFITTIMFSNIQLANPIFPFLIGYYLYLGSTPKWIGRKWIKIS